MAIVANPPKRLLAPGSVIAALALCAAASLFGYLDAADRPSAKFAGSSLLAVLGVASVCWIYTERYQPGYAGDDLGERTVRIGLALLSVEVGLVHLAVIEQHWADYWLYGAFFVPVGIAQVVWAFATLGTRPSELLYLTGAVGNALVVAAWVVTRTVGNLVGPAAHEPESVGFGDVASTAFEILIVVGAIALALRLRRPRAPGLKMGTVSAGPKIPLLITLGLGVVLVSVLALFSTVGSTTFVSHVG